MKIVFIHPDLGIGGAERLVVDMGLSLQRKGHTVHYLTAHHDPSHCFSEIKNGTLKVTEVGGSLPANIFGVFMALCAYLRMIFIAFSLLLRPKFSSLVDCDLIICDQVSAQIPFLKMLYLFRSERPKIIFYCHFPDQLLTTRTNFLKKVYRAPIDWFEEKTTGMADCILVNSHFTASVFRDTFKSLDSVELQVLYPVCNFSAFDRPVKGLGPSESFPRLSKQVSTIFLSLNRYEAKKRVELAILAFAALKKKLSTQEKFTGTIHLIVAGGYDPNQIQNVEYHQELQSCAKELELEDEVTFLKSPSDDDKHLLLHSCTAVLYTPENEHFGIVPLEAMYMGRPVIACNSGGPLETVRDGETGYLCRPEASHFAEKMYNFVTDKSLSREMGREGREHVKKNFSIQRFDEQIASVINKLVCQ
ncbi:alpha-1,3/1,6-mannosyltransferase ALG2-like [Panonychus citri]|uniref:alpha-1,3/1,6-mannosyltransferase ALG2-like n=1 Tax=Panonychus citri TaxID=50023 RepID=UPI0023075C93|nr:alpha-1,3/1,6-mannosyltransferase ALG2-like [Panonychus citri]